jgi:hypothetical protein
VYEDCENVWIERAPKSVPYVAEMQYDIKEAQLNKGALRNLKFVGYNVKAK